MKTDQQDKLEESMSSSDKNIVDFSQFALAPNVRMSANVLPVSKMERRRPDIIENFW